MEGKGMVGRTYFIQLKHPDDVIAPSAHWHGDGRSWLLIDSVVHCSLMVVGARVHWWATLFIDGHSCSLVGICIRLLAVVSVDGQLWTCTAVTTNANAHQ